MVGEQQPAGLQDPGHLLNCTPVVGYGAQRERADHRVEVRVGKLQRLRVALALSRIHVQLPGPVSGDLEHRRAPFHAGQLHAGRVVGQVQPGADGDLQDRPAGPGADPVAAAGEQVPVGRAPDRALVRGQQG